MTELCKTSESKKMCKHILKVVLGLMLPKSLYRFCTVLLVLSNQTFGQQYLDYQVQVGDNVSIIFKKYGLNQSCDLVKFRDLNHISDESKILSGKKYLLPIQTYKYDGKSIRSTINDNDYDQAKNIEKYNDDLYKEGIKKGDYRTNKDLWVPHHILNCSNTQTTSASDVKTFEIFGKGHEEVTIVDSKLKGCVYYLVSGHGGPDPGAIGKNGNHMLCEDEYAYDITLRLGKELISHGALVYIIVRDPNDGIRSEKFLDCDSDEECWKDQKIPLNQKKRLTQRVTAVNNLYKENANKGYIYQRMIILHVDSRLVKKRMDMFFYYFPGSKQSRDLANSLHKTIRSKYNEYQRNRGYTGTVRARDLFMLRESSLISTYIELGNIQNTDDQKRFILESNRQAVAKWLSIGLLEKK